jgi:hypothetical protein
MPTSLYDPVSDVAHLLAFLGPTRVLDIGVGFGKYGVVSRETLDIIKGRLGPGDWLAEIDGVELFEAYRNPVWSVYSSVTIANVVAHLQTCAKSYNVMICSDVIEHFTKEEGLYLIDLCLERTDVLIINTPARFMPQGSVHGNEAETHLSLWRPRDFRGYSKVIKMGKDVLTAVILASPSPSMLFRIGLIFRRETAYGRACSWVARRGNWGPRLRKAFGGP